MRDFLVLFRVFLRYLVELVIEHDVAHEVRHRRTVVQVVAAQLQFHLINCDVPTSPEVEPRPWCRGIRRARARAPCAHPDAGNTTRRSSARTPTATTSFTPCRSHSCTPFVNYLLFDLRLAILPLAPLLKLTAAALTIALTLGHDKARHVRVLRRLRTRVLATQRRAHAPGDTCNICRLL